MNNFLVEEDPVFLWRETDGVKAKEREERATELRLISDSQKTLFIKEMPNNKTNKIQIELFKNKLKN